jgi:Zn-dependent protease
VTVGGGALTVIGTPEALISGRSVLLTAGVVLLVLGGWAVSLCLHEFGHAAVAYRGGDLSVRDKGYLTLDIRRYTDVGLSFVLPIVFLLLGGIPLPGGAVWINHGAIRSRAMRSLVSFAGPATNIVIGALLTAAVALVPMPIGLAVGLSCLALIQVLAFVLNILPVPGLDGFGVLEPYLSVPARQLAARVRPWAPIALFLLIIGVPGVSQLFFEIGGAIYSAVGGDFNLASQGYSLLLFWR